MNFEHLARHVAQAIEATAHTRAVFGDPLQVGACTIVPVAVVSTSLGGGGGVTKLLGVGGGGGLAVRVMPIGFIQERDGQAVFEPIDVPEQVLQAVNAVDASSPDKVSLWTRIYERARGRKDEGEL